MSGKGPPPFRGAGVAGLPGSRRPFRVLVTAYRWDALLVVAASLCFVQFGFLNSKFEREYVSDTIAVLKEGSAERRSFGAPSYVAVSVQGVMKNLDSVWVKKGARAVLELYDGSELQLEEQTLITLKRPFKSAGKAAERVQVVKGKVTVKEGKESRQLEADHAAFSEIPEIKPSAKGASVPEATKLKATPGKNAVVYLRDPLTAEVGFGWPTSVTGFLSVVRKGSREANYVRVENAKSVQAVPGGPGVFLWQVVDASKKVVVGPFQFTVKNFDERSAESLVRDALEGESGDSIDVRL